MIVPEYPKRLYRGNVQQPDTMIVQNKEAEDAATRDGWQVADLFFHAPGA